MILRRVSSNHSGITGPPNPRVSGTGTHTDFRTPAILIYEPQADGSLELVAVENLAFEKAWKAAGNTSPPTFEGVTYNHMVDDPATEVEGKADQAEGKVQNTYGKAKDKLKDGSSVFSRPRGRPWPAGNCWP